MSRCKRSRLVIVLAGLVTCAMVGSLCTACTIEESNQQNPTATEGGSTTTEGGSTMANEETIDANAATVLSYFEELGFEKTALARERSADVTALRFSWVSDARIKTISSNPDPYDGGSIELMVTDENERDFVFYLTHYGSVEMIEDGDGEVVFGVVE